MSHTERVVSLIDMDCFYCQVEEKLDPNLAGKPIAVVQYNQWKGGGIIAVNYLAREKGVTRQMRGDEAKEKCPNIQLPRVPQVRGKADLTKYREAGKQVAEVLKSFTNILERASIDEAYLDLTEAVNNELKNGFPIISLQDLSNTFVVGQETADFLANISQNQNSGFYEDDIKLLVGGLIVEKIRAEVYKKTDRVDYVCMNEGSWLQSDTPMFVKKLRGLLYFSIEVHCSKKNLESNTCSGIIHDAMCDLLFLLGSLLDENGNLNVSKLGLQVEELSEEEINAYGNTDVDLGKFIETVGAYSLLFDGEKSEIVKHRLIFPTLTIHVMQNSSNDINESGIPACASAKLSIRSFHNSMAEIYENINIYLKECWSSRKSSNQMEISLEKTCETWNADVDSVQYKVATKAAQYAYQKPLDSLNNQYTIPVVNILQETLGKNILLLPILSENSYLNELVPIKNYMDATKMFASYMYELGEIPKLSSKSSTSFVSCASVPEICVCGRFEEEIQAASGDSDSQKPKTISEDEKCVCPYRAQVQTKDVAVISDDLVESNAPLPPIPPPKPCKCVLEYQPVDVEIISLVSTSRDPPKPKDMQKKIFTPSVDTINCACTPKRFKVSSQKEENQITPEKETELMKSMRSVGSKISGISACDHLNDKLLTPNMKILGCMCPEKSQTTVCEIEIQKDRMFCPVLKGKVEICNKGGKRRHHIAGPPLIDEEDSEFSLGPLSHCSCSEESITVVPNCDCSKESPTQNKNIEDEID